MSELNKCKFTKREFVYGNYSKTSYSVLKFIGPDGDEKKLYAKLTYELTKPTDGKDGEDWLAVEIPPYTTKMIVVSRDESTGEFSISVANPPEKGLGFPDPPVIHCFAECGSKECPDGDPDCDQVTNVLRCV